MLSSAPGNGLPRVNLSPERWKLLRDHLVGLHPILADREFFTVSEAIETGGVVFTPALYYPS